MLHVHVHLRAVGPGQPPQRPESGEHTVGRAAGVERVELAVERREFERHVDAGQRSIRPLVHERVRGPAGSLRGQFLEEPGIGGRVGIRFGVARDRFAEEVEREAAVVPPLRERRSRGLGGRRSRDEPAGLRERRGPHGAGGERGEQAAAGRLEAEPKRCRQALQDGVVEILAHVPVEGRGIVEHRHAIDEPEQPHLEVVVERGQFPRLLRPPVGRHRGGLSSQRLGQKLLPERLRPNFDRVPIGGREPGGEEHGLIRVGGHRGTS